MHVATPVARSADAARHVSNRLPTTTDQAVGKRIRLLRRAAGMTLRELGEAVGVSGVQFQRYETGASRVAAGRLLAICNALGVQVDTLVDEVVPDKEGQRSYARRNECAELARAFNAVADPAHRRAIIALARTFAGWQEHPGPAAEREVPETSIRPEPEGRDNTDRNEKD